MFICSFMCGLVKVAISYLKILGAANLAMLWGPVSQRSTKIQFTSLIAVFSHLE